MGRMRRWARSLWLVTTLPLGFTAWAGFFYIGAVGRKAKWLVAAAGYLATIAAVLVLHARAPETLSARPSASSGCWRPA